MVFLRVTCRGYSFFLDVPWIMRRARRRKEIIFVTQRRGKNCVAGEIARHWSQWIWQSISLCDSLLSLRCAVCGGREKELKLVEKVHKETLQALLLLISLLSLLRSVKFASEHSANRFLWHLKAGEREKGKQPVRLHFRSFIFDRLNYIFVFYDSCLRW